MTGQRRTPGIGLAFVALLVSRAVTGVVTAALAPLVLVGVGAHQVVNTSTVLSHLAAFGILALVVNTLVAAWIVQAVIRMLGAWVSFARALCALLAGGLSSGLLTALVLAGHPSTVGVAIAIFVSLPVTIAILVTGGDGRTGSGESAAGRYRRPPSAPAGWPGG
jgi:hypothetical protein